MRTMSASAVNEMLSAQTGEVYLHIVRITHASLASDLYFVDDNQSLTRTEGTYQPAAFRITLPNEDDQEPKIRLQIDNVDQSIIEAIRPLQTAPELHISVVRASAPNVNEVGPYVVKLKQFDYDAFTISGTLGYDEDFLNQLLPRHQFTPQTTPGMF